MCWGSLMMWFDPDMVWAAQPMDMRRRQPLRSGEEDRKSVWATVFVTNAVQTGLTIARPDHCPA